MIGADVFGTNAIHRQCDLHMSQCCGIYIIISVEMSKEGYCHCMRVCACVCVCVSVHVCA